MALQLCNNVATTLAAAITSTSQTSISVASATGLPSLGATDWFYLTLSDGSINNPETVWEVVKVTAVSGTTLTVVRGQDNTAAQASWPIGYYIQSRPCAQELRDAMALGLPRIAVADAAYAISTTASVVLDYSSLTAARVLTLPPATQSGQIIWVIDSSGAASSTDTITITRNGTDTIEGILTTMVVNAPYMAICLESNGAGKWAVLTYEEMPLILADAALTISNREDVIVIITALTAARVITLPAAATTGQRITVVDPLGLITGTNTITITRQGSDTINNALTSYVLNVAYARAVLEASGTTHWACTQAPQIASGGSLATSGAFAITFTATAGTAVTLPTSGTLAALGGTNTWAAAQTWSVVSTFTQGFVCTAYAGGTTAGQFWYDSTQKSAAVYANSLKQMLVGCIWTMTATGSNGSATALTNILGTGVGTNVLPASYSLVGKTIRVRVAGTVTTAATPGTTVITLYFSAGTSVSIVASPSMTLLASMTSMPFVMEFDLTFRSTTTAMATGKILFPNSTTGIASIDIPVGSTTAATIVAATSYTVQVCATNGTASGTVYTTQTATIEVLN